MTEVRKESKLQGNGFLLTEGKNPKFLDFSKHPTFVLFTGDIRTI